MFDIIINCALLVVGTFCLVMGVSFFLREKEAVEFRIPILLMGVFVAMWCGGYGVMGFCLEVKNAHAFRTLGLLGIEGYLTTGIYFMAKLAGFHQWHFRIVVGVTVFISFLDYLLFGDGGNLEYVMSGRRMAFYAKHTFARNFHDGYIFFMFVALLSIALYCRKKSRYKREKNFVWYATFMNIAIILASIPDTFMPLFQLPSIPISGFGAVIGYTCIWVMASNFSAISISLRTLSTQILESVHVGVLLTDTGGKVVHVNAFAKQMLKLENVSDKKLSELFELSDEVAEHVMEEAKQSGELQFRWYARRSGAHCMVDPSVVRDHYGEIYCYIFALYDVTREDSLTEKVLESKAIPVAVQPESIQKPEIPQEAESSQESEPLQKAEVLQKAEPEKLFDPEIGRSYCMDDEEFYREILQSYLDSEHGVKLSEYFEGEDWENYRITVHALKSGSLNIGAENLSEEAKASEMALRDDKPEYVREHHRELIAHYDKVTGAIKGYLGRPDT